MVDRESVLSLQPALSRIFAVTSLFAPPPASSSSHSAGSREVLLLLLLFFMANGITSIPSPPSAETMPSSAAAGRRPSTISEQETVENLVRQWAPLVWLAPGEVFMPGNVKHFLSHVHAEKSTPAAASIMHQTADILDVSDDVLLYELDREIGVTEQQTHLDQTQPPINRRDRRMSYAERVIDLPIGKRSVDWYLVANGDIDNELLNTSSFIYGQDPNQGDVPIYSVVSMCDSFEKSLPPQHINDIDSVDRMDRFTNSPIRNQADRFPYKFEKPINRSHISVMMPRNLLARRRRDISPGGAVNNSKNVDHSDNHNISSVHSTTNKNQIHNIPIGMQPVRTTFQPDVPRKKPARIPHFHVTYWMFYPYNQGKTICTLNLGPFGRLPIPVLFGKCLGTRRDFGSHVGDWEHMTLFFKGRNEPEEMYVSAHDAGAYYSYERLTGSFEFRRQETRKGILQHPNFPKTVRTISDHPVLFSAQGSHGLWTAPGKHRFVRVPKLVDINGFGVPWYTWKNIEFSYDRRDSRSGRASTIVGADWLQFMGKWGNPKSKCHPLKRLGLNFCEYNDGPTGIPMKEPHFFCKRPR